MSRTTTPAFDSATQGQHWIGMLFAEFGFASGTLRLCSSSADMQWGGYTWEGGAPLSLEETKETTTLESNGLAFELPGVMQQYIAIALGEFVKGRSAKLWFAPLDANYQIAADPTLEWVGTIDRMTITRSKESATVRIQCESRAIEWDRATAPVYSNEDQQVRYPGDKFFEFLPQSVDAQVVWPSKEFFRK